MSSVQLNRESSQELNQEFSPELSQESRVKSRVKSLAQSQDKSQVYAPTSHTHTISNLNRFHVLQTERQDGPFVLGDLGDRFMDLLKVPRINQNILKKEWRLEGGRPHGFWKTLTSLLASTVDSSAWTLPIRPERAAFKASTDTPGHSISSRICARAIRKVPCFSSNLITSKAFINETTDIKNYYQSTDAYASVAPTCCFEDLFRLTEKWTSFMAFSIMATGYGNLVLGLTHLSATIVAISLKALSS